VSHFEPSVGRIVHFNGLTVDVDREQPKLMPLAAIITTVHGDDCVDLVVFFASSVSFVQRVPYGEGQNRWTWPPRV
jgi:hypothetical protein